MTCDKCKFYSASSGIEGACKRYPPQASAPNYFQFPGVKADWTCGEYASQSPQKSKNKKPK